MDYRIEIAPEETILIRVPDEVVLHEEEIEEALKAARGKKLPETRAQAVASALDAEIVDATANYVNGVAASDLVTITREEYEQLRSQ